MNATRQNSTRTATRLALAALLMFGFGYALVPLYDVFCEITGINGKTGQLSGNEAEAAPVDLSRRVTVEFDTNINGELPWAFHAIDRKKSVHPGEVAEAVFVVENRSAQPITGQAIPSVAPSKASIFFNKTECFCFVRQRLQPGERREMVVRFVVGAGLPQKVRRMTLSYTFFELPEASGLSAENPAQEDKPKAGQAG